MADEQQNNAGTAGQPPRYMRMPDIPDSKLYADISKLGPQAQEWEKIKEQASRKLTPEARAYIVQLIVEGNSNKVINDKLRLRGFLSSESPNLGDSTLTRLRRRKEAQRDVNLLDLEAQQVAHGSLSRVVVYYSIIMGRCFEAICEGYDGPGLIGSSETRLSELRSLLADSVKLLYSWSSKEIANYAINLGEDEKSSGETCCNQADILDGLVAATIREFTAQKKRQLEAAGYKIPPLDDDSQPSLKLSAN